MKRLLAGGLLSGLSSLALAQGASPETRVTFGGFLDSYYAYDSGKPATLDRSFESGATFTTQPARHNEFNINLAYVEALISGDRLRGRLALQAGTSVHSNYVAEPAVGVISGGALSRHIQEAFAGYQVTPSLWIDGGIFYSHMGLESWASKDNLTYTRSLTAEYSPYYSSGVRATWAASSKLTARVDVVNGWQNVSETNTDKGVGLRLDFNPWSTVTLTYYNFFNGEVGSRLRMFNGAGVKLTPSAKTTMLAQFDVGSLEAAAAGDDDSNWFGFTAMLKQGVSDKVALIGRVEGFNDEDQVNIATGLTEPFRGNGVSLGVDVTPNAKFLWRTEFRGFSNRDAVFPDSDGAASKRNMLLVTSLGLIF